MKTTLIGITQVEGKPTIVQVDVLEDGALNPRLGYEKPMTAAEVIALVCQIYDVSYNLDVIQSKQKFACKHCGHVYEKKQTCTQCLGKVKRVK